MPRKKKVSNQPKNPSQKLFPIFEEAENELGKPIVDIRYRESQFRASIDLSSENLQRPNFPPLSLPTRWERLQAEASKRNIPLKPLIAPVHTAIADIERELRRIDQTSMGRLYVIAGPTGSGKTTFLNSLNLFIDVRVVSIQQISFDKREFVENAIAVLDRGEDRYTIVVLEGREAPGSLKNDEIDILLTTLNQDFRSNIGGKTLFVIPTTSQEVAQAISNRAAAIGGMTSRDRPFSVFNGPPRNEYIQIVNDTLRALNDSRTLTEYGITDEEAIGLAEASESIGAFMESCHTAIERKREALTKTVSTLKRKRIHLWMVFCSLEDNARRNHDIIRSLTFGEYQHAQVKRLLSGSSKEIRFWRDHEEIFALAAQYLDLRMTYLPLRTAVTLSTAYGHRELLNRLKQLKLEDGSRVLKREAVRATAQESIASTAIGRFLQKKGFIDHDPTRPGNPDIKQQELFKEVIRYSNSDDKILNAMLADVLRDWNKEPETIVATEVPLNEVKTLIADIAFVTPTDIYCLEMKWRSSLLMDSDVIRETARRVKEYAEELPELRMLLGELE